MVRSLNYAINESWFNPLNCIIHFFVGLRGITTLFTWGTDFIPRWYLVFLFFSIIHFFSLNRWSIFWKRQRNILKPRYSTWFAIYPTRGIFWRCRGLWMLECAPEVHCVEAGPSCRWWCCFYYYIIIIILITSYRLICTFSNRLGGLPRPSRLVYLYLALFFNWTKKQKIKGWFPASSLKSFLTHWRVGNTIWSLAGLSSQTRASPSIKWFVWPICFLIASFSYHWF